MPPPPSTRATISIPGICPLRLCVFCTGARVHASNRTRLCGRIQGPDWHGDFSTGASERAPECVSRAGAGEGARGDGA
eukprot:1156118-Prorocentrum_minimum.AAC.2